MEEKLRILILEDNAADAELMRRALKKEQLKFEARRVETKGALLRELGSFKPDIILADYTLPEFDAMSALRLVKNYAPKTPFVVVTGSISEEVAVTCMKAGASDYVLKDHLVHLGMVVRSALDKKRAEDEKEAAQAELRKSEEKYRVLAETSADGIITTDKVGNLTYVNPSAEKMFNIAASKSLGTNFRDYLTKGSQEEAVKAFLELSKGVTFRKLEFSAVHSDGHIFPIEAAASPIMKNRDFIGMEVIIRDVTKRRWAEDMLRESEERYRTLAEKANDGICVIQDKRSVYANPRFLEMMGYDFSEVLGKDFSGYVSPDTLESFNEEYKKHISGQERGQVFETVFVHRNGKNINVEVSASLVMYGRKRASLIFIRDITERRKMETEIKKNRKFLQDIFDGIQDGISVLDRDFNIINTNKWMEKMYADSMPIVGKKCYKIYQKRGETCPWCPSKKAMETGETQSSVVPYPSEETPAGWMLLSAFPLRDDKGNITGVVESVRDITEQKLAEKALKESEERFQQVVGSTKEWIWEVDKEGLYLYANPKIQEILGYKPEEVIGKKHFYDMFMPEEKEKLKKKALEVFARKEPFQEFLNRNMTKIGKIIWLLTNGVPVLDRKGELKGYRGADIDVTELKETEEALRKTIDELQKYKEVTVGRELQMIELKKKINELSKELGKPTPYDISFSD